MDIHYFKSNPDFQKLEEERKVNYIIGHLNFSKVLLENLDGLYNISFAHKNPDIILPVLDAYLQAIIDLNEELNIDADRLQIVPLDEAEYPLSPYSPNLKILMAIYFAIFSTVIFIGLLGSKFIIENSKK